MLTAETVENNGRLSLSLLSDKLKVFVHSFSGFYCSDTTPNTRDEHLEGVSSFLLGFLLLSRYHKCYCLTHSDIPSFKLCTCSVSQFCRAAMEHSAAVVREVAVRIILSVYRQHGAAVVSYLPPKDAAARKNFLYKALFNEFAKIDGKPAATQARRSGPAL